MIIVPVRTVSGLNAREHWRHRSRRVRGEREAVAWMLLGVRPPRLPCSVLLTRLGPSNGLDDDNLVGALKAVRDAVAFWLGVDDRDSARVRYCYAQQRAKDWAVRIEFGRPAERLE